MGLSNLSEKCEKCPYVDDCDHKRMEALAYFEEPILAPTTQPLKVQLAAPVLRETMTIMVYGKPVAVYKDEIEKELYKSLHHGLNFMKAT